ncbi:MAG: cache domain-containing protein [Desulfococcaceae bacterium]|nr:cache domain-containing protein [Desulfococcaceae bacterium]
MKKIGMMLCMLFCCAALTAYAEEKAKPQEVVQKVREAAEFLASAGEKGLEEFMDKNSRWVWKDTYVFVLNCEKGINAAHPIRPKMVGMKQMGLKDTNGKLFFAEFCNAVKEAKGGWVNYMWPRVGERTPSRKITYVMQVPGTPYQVGAGIYEGNVSMEDLKKMLN